MDLSPYIEELLYSNDCVIIPAIGGFIVNYSPASLDFVEHQLYPPKKAVSFNPKLVNNDGFLANHIVQKEHLSYKQAQIKVDEFSQQIEEDLFNNKIIHFANIGKLYFNTDSKLEFIPENTNFLLDAYGMPNLDCSPIIRSKDYLIKDKEEKEKKLVIKKGNKSPNLWLILSKRPKTAVAAAAILILSLSSPYIYSSLFSNNPNENVLVGNISDTTNNTSNASLLPSLTTTDSNNSSTEIIKELEDTVVATEPIVDDNAEDFVIVLGAFGKQRNADRLAKKLAKDNYLPDVVLKNGLNRVGVQLTCTPKELKTHLKFLQENYNKKAWVVE